MHYTLLLLLFLVGAYKGVSLSLLSATLVGELSNVPFLVGKLQRIAGMPVTSKAVIGTARTEKALLCFTLVVHTLIALLVSMSPSSFGNAAYYLIALSGLVYCNVTHWARAHDLIRPLGSITASSSAADVRRGAAAEAVGNHNYASQIKSNRSGGSAAEVVTNRFEVGQSKGGAHKQHSA